MARKGESSTFSVSGPILLCLKQSSPFAFVACFTVKHSRKRKRSVPLSHSLNDHTLPCGLLCQRGGHSMRLPTPHPKPTLNQIQKAKSRSLALESSIRAPGQQLPWRKQQQHLVRRRKRSRSRRAAMVCSATCFGKRRSLGR